VSHTSDHRDLSHFRDQTVIVVGAGQSAVESAALLAEAGAAVHIVSRQPIHWLAPDREQERGFLERVRSPRNGIAPGWKNWALEHWPYLFYRAPQPRKDRWNRTCYLSAASDWLRDRVFGRVKLHEGCQIKDAIAMGSRAAILRISDGTVIRANHVLLATGYRANIDRVTVLEPSLRSAIATDAGVPRLTASFESSVPGLYFVGFTALRAFGPLYRFVAGATPAAHRVAAAIARGN
jgi:cation diffusion facilitator CzcD-associated flavoprotein CzcO